MFKFYRIKKNMKFIAVLILLSISILWTNEKFREINKKIDYVRSEIIKIKNILIMKKLMPDSLNHRESSFPQQRYPDDKEMGMNRL